MAEAKEKPILVDLGSIRIVRTDDQNVSVERLEKGTSPITKETSERWRTKGHYATILSALRAVSTNEWLIDQDAVHDLESYLNEVQKSNSALEEAFMGLMGR